MINYEPLELLRAIHLPERSIVGLHIFCVNTPKTIYGLSKFLVKHNVKLLYANILAKNGDAELTVFLDITNATEPIDRIVSEISGLDFVRKVSVINPLFKGLIIDLVHFPILLMGRRAWIVSEAVLKGLFKDFKESFGEAGRVFLYHLGVGIGRDLYETYKEYVLSSLGMMELIKAFSKALGWGIIEEIRPLVYGKYRVRVRHNLECEVCKPSNRSCGDFSRGVLTGFFEKILGRRVGVEETKCIAKGDPYCKFIVKLG